MKNYNQKQQKQRDFKPAKVVIWGMSTKNPEEEEEEEEEEEQNASPGSQQPSCYDSSRMDSGMAPGVTRHHHHDMHNRVQALEEEEEEQVDASEGAGRERLMRHRIEVAGRVWIPEIWGQEEFLKDWVDCTVFDSSLMPSKIMSARAALVEECRRASSPGLRVGNWC